MVNMVNIKIDALLDIYNLSQNNLKKQSKLTAQPKRDYFPLLYAYIK